MASGKLFGSHTSMTTAFSRLMSCTAHGRERATTAAAQQRPQQHAARCRATTIKYQLSMKNFTKIPWVGKQAILECRVLTRFS
jgi:hypothetical protein